jgi:hypothetical protein
MSKVYLHEPKRRLKYMYKDYLINNPARVVLYGITQCVQKVAVHL